MGTDLALVSTPDPPAIAGTPAPPNLLELALVGLKPSSAEGYRKDLRAFAEFAGGGSIESKLWKLIRLDQGAANALALSWVARQLDDGLSPATIRRRVAGLKKVVRRARQLGLTTIALEVDMPPACAFKDTAGPGLKGWKRILERADHECRNPGTMRQRARADRNRAIVLLLHDRGLRRSEVAGLELDDFSVSKPAVNVLGKGRTAKEWLTISTRAARAIELWLHSRGTEPGPLFKALHNAQRPTDGPLSDWSINEIVKGLARRAGLTRTCTAHALRHQAITEALDRTRGNARDVQQFSRHKNINTVMIYDDRRVDVGGAISELLGEEKRKR